MLELSREEIVAQAPKLGEMFRRAFEKYPYTVWWLECFQPELREAVLTERMIALFMDARKDGAHCFYAPDLSAAAIIQTGELQVDEVKAEFRQAVIEPERLRNLLETSNKLLPSTATHLYLEALAVDPNCQQKGSGSKLLTEIWKWVQEKSPGKGLALHTSTEKNVAFYAKNGFTVKHHVRIAADNAQPLDLWILLRDPVQVQ